MKRFFSGLLAAVSLFSFCACGSVSKAEEVPEQKAQETKAVKDTELVFIIDKSGSMCGLKDDTIGNFNSVIEEQKNLSNKINDENKKEDIKNNEKDNNKQGEDNNSKKEDNKSKVYVTTVLFDSKHSKLHDRVDLDEVKEMTGKDYRPSGCTALLDAVGDTLNNLSKVEGIKDRNVVVAIITDGYENSSKEYSKKQVKELIESREKDGWKILFFGAGVDAFSDKSGGGIGIRKDRIWAVDYSKNGMGATFGCICQEVTATRAGK